MILQAFWGGILGGGLLLRPCYIFEKFCFVTHDFLIFMGDKPAILSYIA